MVILSKLRVNFELYSDDDDVTQSLNQATRRHTPDLRWSTRDKRYGVSNTTTQRLEHVTEVTPKDGDEILPE